MAEPNDQQQPQERMFLIPEGLLYALLQFAEALTEDAQVLKRQIKLLKSLEDKKEDA